MLCLDRRKPMVSVSLYVAPGVLPAIVVEVVIGLCCHPGLLSPEFDGSAFLSTTQWAGRRFGGGRSPAFS